MKAKPQREGYRVDILMESTGTHTEYTSLKVPETLEQCQALGRGIKQQVKDGRRTGGRIVKVTGREKTVRDFVELVEEWNTLAA